MSNDYTNAEYEKDVSEYAESILSETIADNPEADADAMREAVQERLHETVDSSQNVIYTWRAQLVCAHSANDGYSASEFGADSIVDGDGCLNWSVMAYGAMYADVSEELWPLFDEWATVHETATGILDELDDTVEQLDPTAEWSRVQAQVFPLGYKGDETLEDLQEKALAYLVSRCGEIHSGEDEKTLRAECKRIMEAKRDEALRTLRRLGNKAKPQTEEEWGSDRQVEAENDFGAFLRTILNEEKWERFCSYALKATSEERVAYGITLASPSEEVSA